MTIKQVDISSENLDKVCNHLDKFIPQFADQNPDDTFTKKWRKIIISTMVSEVINTLALTNESPCDLIPEIA